MVDGYNGEQMTDYEEDLDWDSVGNPPPAHKFNVRLEKAEHAFSKKNKHMVKANFKIEGFDPEFPDDEKFIGRTIFTNFNFTVEGAFLVKAFCDATGIAKPSKVSKPLLEDWAAEALNTQTCVLLKHRIFNEQTMADISKFLPLMDVSNDVDPGVDDQSGNEEEEVADEGEEGLEALDADDAPEEEPEPVAPPRTRSLRDAAAATKPAPKATTASKTNGHANGHTNGTNGVKKPPVVAAPAKKGAKPTAGVRR